MQLNKHSYLCFIGAIVLVILTFALGFMAGKNQISPTQSRSIRQEISETVQTPTLIPSPTLFSTYTPSQEVSQLYTFSEFNKLEDILFGKTNSEQQVRLIIDRQHPLSEEGHNLFIAHIYSEVISSESVNREELIKIARSILSIDSDPSYYEEFNLAFLPYSSKDTIGSTWDKYIGSTPIAWYNYSTIGNLAGCSGTETINIYFNGIR